MRHWALAASAAACANGAFAQSSVVLFGTVDNVLTVGNGSLTRKQQLNSSGNTPSRIGFRGVEDLGGGLSAGFWLEAGLGTDSGVGAPTNTNNQASGTGTPAGGSQGLTFNRRSTLSLAGTFGEIRLGRDFTPQFLNLAAQDPFGTLGVGSTLVLTNSKGGPTNIRASNGLTYYTPAGLGGFFGELQTYLGENASGTATARDGDGTGVRLGWGNGATEASFAAARTRFAAGNITTTNIGANHAFGDFRAMAVYSVDKVANGRPGAQTLTATGWLLGGRLALGPGEVRVSYSVGRTDAAGSPESRKMALGYVYNLSKRTAVYATVARIRNSGGATLALGGATTGANEGSTGVDLGLRHNF